MDKLLLRRCQRFIWGHQDPNDPYRDLMLLDDLDAAIAQQAEPVAWVPRAIADSDVAVVGEFLWLEVEEAPFTVSNAALWECCPLYADAPQPPATSGMPEMPEPDDLIEIRVLNTWQTVDAFRASTTKDYGTACYAAGRRQGLEEARTIAKDEADLRYRDRCYAGGNAATNVVSSIVELLQTRGKNDSGVV